MNKITYHDLTKYSLTLNIQRSTTRIDPRPGRLDI